MIVVNKKLNKKNNEITIHNQMKWSFGCVSVTTSHSFLFCLRMMSPTCSASVWGIVIYVTRTVNGLSGVRSMTYRTPLLGIFFNSSDSSSQSVRVLWLLLEMFFVFVTEENPFDYLRQEIVINGTSYKYYQISALGDKYGKK